MSVFKCNLFIYEHIFIRFIANSSLRVAFDLWHHFVIEDYIKKSKTNGKPTTRKNIDY